jgi:hypothetical protein
MDSLLINNLFFNQQARLLETTRAGHVERYQLQSYRFKHFFVTL